LAVAFAAIPVTARTLLTAGPAAIGRILAGAILPGVSTVGVARIRLVLGITGRTAGVSALLEAVVTVPKRLLAISLGAAGVLPEPRSPFVISVHFKLLVRSAPSGRGACGKSPRRVAENQLHATILLLACGRVVTGNRQCLTPTHCFHAVPFDAM